MNIWIKLGIGLACNKNSHFSVEFAFRKVNWGREDKPGKQWAESSWATTIAGSCLGIWILLYLLYLGYFSYSTCYLVNLWTIITCSSSKNIFFWLASWYINPSWINHLLFILRYICFPGRAWSSSQFSKHLVHQMLNLKHRSALKSSVLKQLLLFCWSASSGGQSQSYK